MSNPNLLTVNRKYGIGGFLKDNAGIIGTGLGAVAGAFAGNPMAGAKIGGMAGGFVENVGGEEGGAGQRRSRTLSTPGYTGTSGDQGFSFKNGGFLPIGQDATRVTGPSHEEGGVRVQGGAEVEGGETMDFIVEGDSVRRSGDKTPYVFSKRLTVPGSNKSFADVHSNLVKRGVGDDKIKELATLQESVNGNSSSRKKEGGGPLTDINVENMPMPPGEGGGGTLDAALNTGERLLPYAGDLLNIGRGVFGDSDLPEAPRMNIPRTAVNEARKMPTEVNVQPQLANVSRSLRTLTASPNTSTQAKLAGHSKSLQARDQILAQKENQENKLKAQKAQHISQLTGQLDSRQAQANHQAQVRQSQNQLKADAAKSQLLSQGLAGLSRTRQQQQAAKNQTEAQTMAVMAQMAGKDPAVRESTVRSILPMINDPQTRKQLLQFIGQSDS